LILTNATIDWSGIRRFIFCSQSQSFACFFRFIIVSNQSILFQLLVFIQQSSTRKLPFQCSILNSILVSILLVVSPQPFFFDNDRNHQHNIIFFRFVAMQRSLLFIRSELSFSIDLFLRSRIKPIVIT
jgi:hypothetical protein